MVVPPPCHIFSFILNQRFYDGRYCALKITIFFLLVAALLLYLFSSSSSIDLSYLENIEEIEPHEAGLDKILKEAAMPSKTVIITSVNAGWTEQPNSVLALFLESFRILDQNKSRRGGEERLLQHLIIAAMDETAYERCLELVHEGLHCYAVKTEGVDFSTTKAFMSEDYKKMMWRRIRLLRSVLQMGYSFIFTDVDILWLRNPFPHFLPDGDFQIACDHFYGNARSTKNKPNAGYYYARYNLKTIQLFKYWDRSRLIYDEENEQDAFKHIRKNKIVGKIGVKIKYLDTKLFVSFCSYSEFDMDFAITIHANCCNGLSNKVRNLEYVLDDWKAFKYNYSKQAVKQWEGPNSCSLSWI